MLVTGNLISELRNNEGGNGYINNAHIFQKSRSHLKILSARYVTWRKLCTDMRRLTKRIRSGKCVV